MTTEEAQPPDSSNREATLPVVASRPRTFLDRLVWTVAQRRAMVAVLALILAVFAWRLWSNPAYISDPQPTRPARYDDLADRLDPNSATWRELAAIPTLGEKRAKAIVAYREAWLKRHPGEPAYKNRFDLAAVDGIGAAMIETMDPHLIFPE